MIMEGLLEVISSEKLFKKKELNPLDEFESSMFRNKTIMRFQNLENAIKFGRGFVINYLIPTYGQKEALKFPMDRSEPAEIMHSLDDACRKFAESLELAQRNPNKEVWLVIPKDRYSEVQKYIDSLKK
jgi:hypothetical protein